MKSAVLRAALISFVVFGTLAGVLTCLGVGCTTTNIEGGTVEEIQQLRVNHCRRVLAPETCRVMVKKSFYRTLGECNLAFDKDGFCRRPIASTIQDMNDCALRIGRDWALPEECLRLRHE